MGSICSKDFIVEFQVPEFSEEHQKLETHKHTHTHTHTHTQSRKDFQLQKLLKKRTSHINMFKHLNVYLSFVEYKYSL